MNIQDPFSGGLPTYSEIRDQAEAGIPSECAGCAVQCELGSQVGSLILKKHLMLGMAEMLVSEQGDAIDKAIDEAVPTEVADDLKRLFRTSAAENIDDVESELEATKALMATASAKCDGVLKMRASKKGTTYTVAVCTSPDFYITGEEHIPVHIDRSE